MLKKRIKIIIAAVLLSFSSLFTVSCSGGSVITGIRMSNQEVVDVPFGNFTYDGIKVTVLFENGENREIDLTEDMISEVERLKFFKMGEQDINIVFRDTFTTTMKVNVVLNEFNDIYELVGYTCVYDAKPHEVKLNHELPEGASIVYPKGNIFTNAGTYEVTGVITKSGYATITLTTTLTILENEHDEDGIVFADKTVPFNGEAQTIEAENVPEGVSVSYTLYDETKTTQLNKAYYAGKYCFVARFTNADPNYKKIEDKEAYLTITKIDYDLSTISFDNVVKYYDGQSYTPSITNKEALPQGLFVHYEMYDENGNPVNDNSASGKYTMKAVFTGGDVNHNPIEPMVATLTVAKKIIYIKDVLDFDGKEASFTGKAIYIDDPVGLPNGVEYSLDQNGFTYVGEYPVVATFVAKDSNETVDLNSSTVYLLIQPSTTSVRVYDGLDDEEQPIYHDLTLADIDIDVSKNTATIATEQLRLGDDFLELDCGIAVDEENEPLRFKHIIIDPETGAESYINCEPKDFIPGESYQFTVGFRLTNNDSTIQQKLNESLTISPIVGTFKYGHVRTKSGEYEYEGSFDASNISIIDGEASITNVETGVEAKYIKFLDPLTSEEVPASELEHNHLYEYEVGFKKQESAIFVNETGSFVYMNVEPFSTSNLMLLNNEISIVDTISGVTARSIILKEGEQDVALNALEVGHTYDYTIYFNSIGEVGVNPGIIWDKQSGSFTYDRVKDSTTNEPITLDNISIEEDKVSIVNIDPSIVVSYVKFYYGEEEVPFTALLPGNTYTYEVAFKSSNTNLYKVETGTMRYSGRVTAKSTNGEYNASFSNSNFLLIRKDVGDYNITGSVIDVNPEVNVKDIKIYNGENEVSPLSSLVENETYTYKVFFDSENGFKWQTETGTFVLKIIRSASGTAVFHAPSNLRFKDGQAYLIDVTEGLDIISIKMYRNNTREEVTDLSTLTSGDYYFYRILVRSSGTNVYLEEMNLIQFSNDYIGA